MTASDDKLFSMSEGIVLSVMTLAAGAFVVVGASANAPHIRASLGLSAVGIGAIASVSYLGAMATSRLGGRATDRVGPAAVISVGLALMAAGLGVAAVAPVAILFYLGILLAGMGYGVINPATNVLANPSTARRRGLVMSIKQSGVPVGGIAAGALLPSLSSAVGWRAAFLLPVLVCCGVALLVALRGRHRSTLHGRATDVVRSSVRMRLPHGFAYGFVTAGAQVSLFAFTTVYLTDSRGLSPDRAGLGVSLLLLGGLLGRPAWGWLSDLYPEQRLAILQVTAVVGGVAIVAVWTVPAGWLPVALLVVGMTAVGWNGVYVAAVAEAGEPHRVGWTTGASLTMINLGAVVCPIMVGLIVQLTHNWAAGWSACSAISLLGFVIVRLSRLEPAVEPAVPVIQ
ncbi:MAG: major facilitator superfamily 1 [Frankiales bacterium]|nr:major facilitator superfamily 1 [Frankiales bacterium]